MKVSELVFYLDMDNTTVIFSTRENEEEQVAHMYDEGFYLNLPAAYKLDEVLKVLRDMGATVKILSGLIDSPFVAKEKIRWCQRRGFKEEDIILLPMNERKCDYVSYVGKSSILVDDFPRYVQEWREMGGTSIRVDRKHEGFATMDSVARFCDILVALSKWSELDVDDQDKLMDSWIYLFKNN